MSFVLISIFQTNDSTAIFWTRNLIYSLSLGAILPIYCKTTKKDFFMASRFLTKPKAKDVLFSMALAFTVLNFMTPLNAWFCEWIETLGFSQPTVDIPMDNVACLIIFVCIIPAVCEEILFRGGIFNGLLQKSCLKGILLSAFLFALFHMNPAQTLPQIVLGCVFALVFAKSGSIYSIIICHFFSNLCVVILSLTLEPTGFYEKYQWEVFICGLVLFVLLLVLYIPTKSVRIEKEETTIAEKNDLSATVAFVSAIVLATATWILTLVS